MYVCNVGPLLTRFYQLQLKTAPFAILGAFVTIIVASIIPALRGADMEQSGAGPFTKVRLFCFCSPVSVAILRLKRSMHSV